MPEMVSKSRPDRRSHAIELVLWEGLFASLAERLEQRNANEHTWWTLCRCRCATTSASAAAGSIPRKKAPKRSAATPSSKRRYFYDLRMHLVVSGAGEQPVGFVPEAGSEAATLRCSRTSGRTYVTRSVG